MTLCELRKTDDILIITLPQSIDHIAAKALENEILGYLNSNPKSLLCDCSRTTYVSSSGLRVFIAVAKTAKIARIHFGLFCLSTFVNHIFDMSGFAAIIPLYKTEEAALQAASKW